MISGPRARFSCLGTLPASIPWMRFHTRRRKNLPAASAEPGDGSGRGPEAGERLILLQNRSVDAVASVREREMMDHANLAGLLLGHASDRRDAHYREGFAIEGARFLARRNIRIDHSGYLGHIVGGDREVAAIAINPLAHIVDRHPELDALQNIPAHLGAHGPV